MLERKGNITDVWPRIFINTELTITDLILSDTLNPVLRMGRQGASDCDKKHCFSEKPRHPRRQKQDFLEADY